MWRENVLKDWHAIRFDRRPPAARAPTTRPPRRRWRFATRCDASDVSRHLVDGDWRASSMHRVVGDTDWETPDVINRDRQLFLRLFQSIYSLINITYYRLCIYKIHSFYITQTLQISCICMRTFNNFYHGSVSMMQAPGKRVKTQRSAELLLFVHSIKKEGNSNRTVCTNFRQSFRKEIWEDSKRVCRRERKYRFNSFPRNQYFSTCPFHEIIRWIE